MDNSVDQPPASKRPRLHLDESIAGIDVNETLGMSTKTPASMFPAPDEESPLNILNSLNDHCLQEIFKRISIVDLSSATEVCMRFKQNAEQVFSIYHEKRFRFVSLTLVKSQVFQNFVHLIKSVYLNGSQASRCLNYFNGSSKMRSLHLRSADIHVGKLRPLLSKLTSLEITSCQYIGKASDLLSFCRELQYLKVKHSKFGQFSPCKMPKLQKFEFEDYAYTQNLRSFIETNTQLSSISVRTISKLPPNDFVAHLLKFRNLKQLNSLKLPCFQLSATPLIASLRTDNIPMEQLELIDCRLDDESFPDICQMKSIAILSITGIETLSSEQFVGVAKELPELRVLRIETPYKHAPQITIDDIISFVQHSKNLSLLTIGVINHMTIDQASYKHLLDLIEKDQRKTLTITIVYENTVKILVPKQTLIMHKEKIRIVKIKYDHYSNTGDNASESEDDDDSDDDISDDVDSDDDVSDGGEDLSESSDDTNASEDDEGSDGGDDSSESSDISRIIGSVDGSDDNSDDNWLEDVYSK